VVHAQTGDGRVLGRSSTPRVAVLERRRKNAANSMWVISKLRLLQFGYTIY